MWNGQNKAFTISTDDGILQDKKFVEMLNKYDLKATFNINSGMMYNECLWCCQGLEIRRMNHADCGDLFLGHEVAAHTLTHPTLTELDDYMFERQIVGDKFNLETIFKEEIIGFALPGGYTDTRLVKLCQKFGIKYVRGSSESRHFGVPQNIYDISATIKYSNLDAIELIEEFINLKTDVPSVMHIWGHSYELDFGDGWQRFEKICRLITGKEDIFYGTNKEVYAPFFERTLND